MKCYHQVIKSTLLSIGNIPNTFLDAYNASVSGKIHPAVISVRNIIKVLGHHPELENTLYLEDHTLFYELCSIFITKLAMYLSPHIMGIMYLPKLAKAKPLPLFTFYPVNFRYENKNLMVKVPNRICTGDYTCWDFPPGKCIEMLHKLVCHQSFSIHYNPCLLDLQKNHTHTALWRSRMTLRLP